MVSFSSFAYVVQQDHLLKLVDEILDPHKRLASVKSDSDKSSIERAIETTDKKIDKLVYELYALTEKRIRLTE